MKPNSELKPDDIMLYINVDAESEKPAEPPESPCFA